METNITMAEAAALLENDKARRAVLVREAIQQTLEEHNCDLVAMPQIEDGRIVAVVQIIPK